MILIHTQLLSGEIWTSVLEKHGVIGFVLGVPWDWGILEWVCDHCLADTVRIAPSCMCSVL